MKTLFLIRHAKSSWKDISLDDFDRPLNKRGKKDAPLMGELLKIQNIKPDIIYSSPAKRTKNTVKIIADKIGYKNPIKFEPKIYETSFSTLKDIISSIDDAHNLVFLFGHNPSLNIFAEKFCSFYENIPTCGIVVLKFSCDSWKEISSKNCELEAFDFPKKYK